jgi:hypothetical protein
VTICAGEIKEHKGSDRSISSKPAVVPCAQAHIQLLIGEV